MYEVWPKYRSILNLACARSLCTGPAQVCRCQPLQRRQPQGASDHEHYCCVCLHCEPLKDQCSKAHQQNWWKFTDFSMESPMQVKVEVQEAPPIPAPTSPPADVTIEAAAAAAPATEPACAMDLLPVIAYRSVINKDLKESPSTMSKVEPQTTPSESVRSQSQSESPKSAATNRSHPKPAQEPQDNLEDENSIGKGDEQSSSSLGKTEREEELEEQLGKSDKKVLLLSNETQRSLWLKTCFCQHSSR